MGLVRTVNRYLIHIRKRIVQFCQQQSHFQGEVEVDEFYLKRGRGVFRETPVFGIFKRGGRVYTKIVPDCAKTMLQAIIQSHVAPDSIIYSDWLAKGYNGLVDLGYKKHYRVNHGANQFVHRKKPY